MNKENILFGIIGLLVGVIIGYLATNSLNRSVPLPVASSGGGAQLPPDHPSVGDSGAAGGGGGGMQADVAETIEQARREPKNFEAQMKAGGLFYQIKRYEQALEFYRRAQQIKPDDFEVLSQLGNSTFDLGQYDEAARWYNEALRVRPDAVNVRTDLGLTYYLRTPRDLDRAIEIYREALKYDPRHEMTLQNLATALIDKGERAAAGESLRRLEEVNPNNQALAQLRARLNAQ